MEVVFSQDSVKAPTRKLMHAKEIQPAMDTPRAPRTERSQRVLGGVLWLGLTALLVYIST